MMIQSQLTTLHSGSRKYDQLILYAGFGVKLAERYFNTTNDNTFTVVVGTAVIVDTDDNQYIAVALKRGGIQSNQGISKPTYDVVLLDRKYRVYTSYSSYTTRSLIDTTKYTLTDRKPNIAEIKHAIKQKYSRVLIRTKSLANALISEINNAISDIINQLTHMMITDPQINSDIIMLGEYQQQLRNINKQLTNVFDQPFYNIKQSQLHSVENKIIQIVNRLRNNVIQTGQGSVPVVDQKLVDAVIDKIRMYNNFSG